MTFENKNPIGLRMRYLILLDAVLILFSIVFSFIIRYEALLNVWPYLRFNWTFFPLAIGVRLGAYYSFHLYRRLWRYASTREFKTILLASLSSSVFIYILNFGVFPVLGIPHCPSGSIWALESILSLAFLGGSRFLLRIWQERMTPQDALRLKTMVQSPLKVLIVGAGDAGAMILREMQNNPGLGLKAVGFVDDNSAKLHMQIYDVPVLGRRANIPALVRKHAVDEVIIAMPTAPGKAIRAIKSICDEAQVRYRTVPGIYDLIDGTLSVTQIREVQIEDLLRRDLVKPCSAGFSYLRGAVVMITGAGGSIGSELSRQVAAQQPRALILLDQAESAIYRIDLELRERFPKLDIAPVIADIRHLNRLESIMARYQPEVIFHAAAYKHVPLMERHPDEAILNNVQGSQNLLQAAERHDVARFVLISTDKAVNPSNFMGASKRITELLVQDAARRTGRDFVAVRFGNVLGSEGSVVPLFKRQIANGGPVTVTHPEVNRYFMTIPEAVQLVIQAGAMGSGGEIFVLDMGEPVKIVDLARDLITLSGLQPDRDIDIVFTGLRPGEKLEERLFNEGENYTLTSHEKIFVVTDSMPIEPQTLHWGVRKLIHAAQNGERDALWGLIQSLAPECQPAMPRTQPPEIEPGAALEDSGAVAWEGVS